MIASACEVDDFHSFDVEVHDSDEVIQAIVASSDAITLKGNELNPIAWCLHGHASGDGNSSCSRLVGA